MIIFFCLDITLSRLLGDDSDEFLSFLVNNTNLSLNSSQALLESKVNVSGNFLQFCKTIFFFTKKCIYLFSHNKCLTSIKYFVHYFSLLYIGSIIHRYYF